MKSNEIKEEYHKMLAFRYDFTNGVEYTKEELDWYRERFNKYYNFESNDLFIVEMLVLDSEIFSINHAYYDKDCDGGDCIKVELGYEINFIETFKRQDAIELMNEYSSKLFNDYFKLSNSGFWLYINFKGE